MDECLDLSIHLIVKVLAKELAVFQLRHNNNMTFEEIGRKLDIKAGTAKVRYYRAVTAFKAWLKKHYPDIYDLLNEGSG